MQAYSVLYHFSSTVLGNVCCFFVAHSRAFCTLVLSLLVQCNEKLKFAIISTLQTSKQTEYCNPRVYVHGALKSNLKVTYVCSQLWSHHVLLGKLLMNLFSFILTKGISLGNHYVLKSCILL